MENQPTTKKTKNNTWGVKSLNEIADAIYEDMAPAVKNYKSKASFF